MSIFKSAFKTEAKEEKIDSEKLAVVSEAQEAATDLLKEHTKKRKEDTKQLRSLIEEVK